MSCTKWALLCGGDFYLPKIDGGSNQGLNPLNGCVRDVEETHKLLLKLGVNNDNIIKLTASNPKSGSSNPPEPSKCWPTQDNIISKLSAIRKKAKPGDLVYFHFSGHGATRRNTPALSAYQGDNRKGMVLITTDVLRSKKYLTGYHLGEQVREMADSGLHLTLILDSCFSGGGFRHNSQSLANFTARTPNSIDDIPIDCNSEIDGTTGSTDFDIFESINCENTRNVGVTQVKSLPRNPEHCTLITACSGNNVAGEASFNGTIRGLLTHHMLECLEDWLKSNGYGDGQNLPPYSYFVNLVGRKLGGLDLPTNQAPTIIGQGQCEFFGTFEYFEKEIVNVFSRKGKVRHMAETAKASK